ncbi:EpsG family protein [Enterococcus lactis]|nr:EpsG family protein [Enterococcus faecium]
MDKETSVFLYLATFIFSSIIIEIGVRKRKSDFYTFLGILFPSLLATFRSPIVGTDTQMYQHMFEGYLSIPSLVERFKYLGFKEFLNTLIAQIGVLLDNFNIYLFIFSFSTLILVVKAIYKYVYKDSVSIAYFAYLCLFFPQSLNIMRQSLAIAIVFWSFQYILEKKPKKYFISIIIATGVHISAFIAIPLYFLLNKERKFNYWVTIVISGLIMISTFSIGPIFKLIATIPGYERYSFYASYDGEINNRIIIVNVFIFVMFFLVRKYFNGNKSVNSLSLLLLFIGVLLGVTGFISPYIKRLGVYFDIVQILLISQMHNMFLDKYQHLLVKYVTCILCMAYFILYYYYLGFSDIVPYNFYIY